ncbi:MAG: M48 family metallopeptidase, partial [Planctomycetota bacterium]|nr:M48 family metallopeptidase [Planctomycetota bacterium]
MDFFANQDKARGKTKLLIFYFFLAIFMMIVVIYGVIAAILNGLEKHPGQVDTLTWLHLEVLAMVAVGVIVVVGMSCLFKIGELRGGGSKVAEMLGGRLINSNTTDSHERIVMNVVEEMALASGTPVPPVYVLDQEGGINAFAAGYSATDAVIGVNRGTIETLNRAELQGVIAHEFSHVFNGDMRLNIKLIGWLFGIQVLAIIGYYMFRFAATMSHGRSKNEGGNPAIVVFVIGIVVMIVGFLGQWFARMIQAAISRQREYLADASAVQFTRDPNTIGGALKVIGAYSAGSRLEVPTASQASHMFFAEGVSLNFGGMATHPPLLDRIQRVDSSFDGDFSRYLQQRYKKSVKAKAKPKKPKDPTEMLQALPVPGLGGEGFGPMGEMTQAMPAAELPLSPVAIIAGVGMLDEEHVEHSSKLVQQISAGIQSAIHDPFSARCVVYCLLLDQEAATQEKQLETILQAEGQSTVDEVRRLMPLVEKL